MKNKNLRSNIGFSICVLKIVARCKSASANLNLGKGVAPSPQRKRQAIVALFAPGCSLQTSLKTGLLSQSYFCFLISKIVDLKISVDLKNEVLS
jgi:hypothetical protein